MNSITKSVKSFMDNPFRRAIVSPATPSNISVATTRDEPRNDPSQGVVLSSLTPPPPIEEVSVVVSETSPPPLEEVSITVFKSKSVVSVSNKSELSADDSDEESIKDDPIIKHILVNFLKE